MLKKEKVYTSNGVCTKEQSGFDIISRYTASEEHEFVKVLDGKPVKKYFLTELGVLAVLPAMDVTQEEVEARKKVPNFLSDYTDKVLYLSFFDDSVETSLMVTSFEEITEICTALGVVSPIPSVGCSSNADFFSKSYMMYQGTPFTFLNFVESSSGVKVKLYLYEQYFGWFGLWMSAKSWSLGKLVGKGSSLIANFYDKYNDIPEDSFLFNKRKTKDANAYNNIEIIHSVEDGYNVLYRYTYENPIFGWEANFYDDDLNLVGKKVYTPSKFALRFLCNFSVTGKDYQDLGLPSYIMFWLGDSYNSATEENEYYFITVDGTHTIDKVCADIGIPVPYPEDMQGVIKETPENFRFKYYDIYHQGEGYHVPCLIWSIVKKENKIVGVKFYSFSRPWESKKPEEVLDSFDFLKRMENKELGNYEVIKTVDTTKTRKKTYEKKL
jgi:hypothetical protein